MMVLLIILGVVVFAALAVPVVLTFVSVQGLSDPKLVPMSSEEQRDDANSQWARENDFAFVGNFSMKVGISEASMMIWRRSDRPTFFCRYIVQAGTKTQTSFDFVTMFENEIMLTTNNKADSQMLPPAPGHYLQSFSTVSLDEQWNQHLQMENYLMDVGGALLVQNDRPFEDCFVDTIRKQVEFVRSLSLWPLRGTYWFFIRRKLRHNLSIQAQHDKSLITLPNELPGFKSTSEPVVTSDASKPEEVTVST